MNHIRAHRWSTDGVSSERGVQLVLYLAAFVADHMGLPIAGRYPHVMSIFGEVGTASPFDTSDHPPRGEELVRMPT